MRKVSSYFYPFWPYSMISLEVVDFSKDEKDILQAVFDAGGGSLYLSSACRPSDSFGPHRLCRALDFVGDLPLLYKVFSSLVDVWNWGGGLSLGIDSAAKHLHVDNLSDGVKDGRKYSGPFFFFELDRKSPPAVVGYFPLSFAQGNHSFFSDRSRFYSVKEKARLQYSGVDHPGWGWTIAAGLGGLAAGIVLAQSENVAASTIKDLALQKIKRSILPTVAGALAGRAVDYASHYAKRALDALPSVPGVNGPVK